VNVNGQGLRREAKVVRTDNLIFDLTRTRGCRINPI